MSLLSSALLSATASDVVGHYFEDEVPGLLSFTELSSTAWADTMVVSPLLRSSESLPLKREDDEHVELTDICDFSSRRQPLLPPTTFSSTTPSRSAIPPLQSTTSLNTTSQDVRSSVNASASSSYSATAIRSNANSHNHGTPVSTPIHHDLNQSLYTPVCFNIQDLAAHHGIPQVLPPLPRPSVNQKPSPAIPDFTTLRNNYLSMLSQRPSDTESPAATSTVAPADLQASGQDNAELFNEFFASPQELAATLNAFLSPAETPLQDFDDASPFESPFSDFLTTPVMGADDDADMLTSPLMDYGMALFGGVIDEPEHEMSSKMPDLSTLYTMSPTMTPALDAINPTSLYPSPCLPSEQDQSTSSPASSKPTLRRKSQATGTRKNISVNSMVPLDAPTQPRSYLFPSVTSRKEVPAVIAKKRARSQAFEDDDDEGREAPLPPTATEKEQIEWKRRQNTLAARKSRQRKLVYLQDLEKKLDDANREVEKWKVRSQMLSHTLATHNIPVPRFDED